MRIFRNSAARILMQISIIFGQLPYHALKLVINNYELMQDAFQKLCRAGVSGSRQGAGTQELFRYGCRI